MGALLFQTKATRAALWWGPLPGPDVGPSLEGLSVVAILLGDGRRPNVMPVIENNNHWLDRDLPYDQGLPL